MKAQADRILRPERSNASATESVGSTDGGRERLLRQQWVVTGDQHLLRAWLVSANLASSRAFPTDERRASADVRHNSFAQAETPLDSGRPAALRSMTGVHDSAAAEA
jgi:hypothetical protein